METRRREKLSVSCSYPPPPLSISTAGRWRVSRSRRELPVPQRVSIATGPAAAIKIMPPARHADSPGPAPKLMTWKSTTVVEARALWRVIEAPDETDPAAEG